MRSPSSSTTFALVALVAALTAGCARPDQRARSSAEASTPGTEAATCIAIKPALRRTETLFSEISAGKSLAAQSPAGRLALLQATERALRESAADLSSSFRGDRPSSPDAATAARELVAASRDLSSLRDKLEAGLLDAATPLRGAREKAWETRTICEATARRSADCAAVARLFGERELAKWTRQETLERARQSIARVVLRDPRIARDVGFVRARLDASVDALSRLARTSLTAESDRFERHMQTASESLTRIEDRCREHDELPRADWVSAPEGTDPRALTALVIAVAPAAMRDVIAKSDAKGDVSMGSGSGAIVVREVAGRRSAFVVTNRHVVEGSTRAKIAVDGGRALLDADLLYRDPHHDLAVLEVRARDGHPAFEAGVGLETRPPSDQEAVTAAGFPAMGRQPSYQVTKGYVSNRSVRFGDSSALTYIQHTAPIDPGSSGGPLFSERGRLLGINTLKAREREGTAFAVPANVVVDALREAVRPRADADGAADARLACLAMLASLAVAEPPPDSARKLSTSFVAAVGPRAWERRVAELPSEERERAAAAYERDPVGMLRWAALDRLHASIHAAGGVTGLEMCEQVTIATEEGGGGQIARIVIQTAAGPRELTMARERSEWTVDSFDFRDPSTERHRAKGPQKRR